jgi:hypothetical protein
LVTVDRTAPTITASSFNYLTNQSVKITFSESVFMPGAPSTLNFNNLTTGQTFNTQVQFDTTHTGTFTRFQSTDLLPDGNYRAALSAGNVTDLAGNPMAAPFSLDFFILAGDANHDRHVDVTDLGILATNWQGTGTFSQADFNLDGHIDVTDLGILATNWQKTLPAPAVPAVRNLAASNSAPLAIAQPTRSRRTPRLSIVDDVLA